LTTAGEYPNDRIKHMELIQGVVARLANEAALIKGWALTVSSAIFGFAATSLSWRVAGVGLLPVFAFWGLNAYYLRAERQYRKLYDRVRSGISSDPFTMDARNEDVDSWWMTNWSPTLFAFYGIIVVVGLILIIAGICHRTSAP
jgi:hypothetical protein